MIYVLSRNRKSKWWNDTDKRCLKSNCKDRWPCTFLTLESFQLHQPDGRMRRRFNHQAPARVITCIIQAVFHLVSPWWYNSPVLNRYAFWFRCFGTFFGWFSSLDNLLSKLFTTWCMHLPLYFSSLITLEPGGMSTTPSTLFTISIFVHLHISLLLIFLVAIFQCLLQVEPPLSLGLHDGVGVGDGVPELLEPDHANEPPRLRHVRQAYVVRVFPNLIDRMKVNHAMKWSIQG